MLAERDVDDCYQTLAGVLRDADAAVWEARSLCEWWRVREVVAHMTMPARMSAEDYAREMASARGDLTVMSDAVASRDGALPVARLVVDLRSRALAQWRPPAGGLVGALHHAVVHSVDITLPFGASRCFGDETAAMLLDGPTAGGVATVFGVDLTATGLHAVDIDWTWGQGDVLSAPADELIAILAGRDVTAVRS